MQIFVHSIIYEIRAKPRQWHIGMYLLEEIHIIMQGIMQDHLILLLWAYKIAVGMFTTRQSSQQFVARSPLFFHVNFVSEQMNTNEPERSTTRII